jgi:hypothetical protein
VYNLGLTQLYGTFSINGMCRTAASPDDYMSRGFTLATQNAWVDSNQIGGTGSAYDNSGEGIMIQDHLNGSECFSTAITNNTIAKPSSIPGNSAWMGVWNSHAVGLFVGYNRALNGITYFALPGSTHQYGGDISEIQHVSSVTGLPLNSPGNVTNIAGVKDFRRFECPGDPVPGIPQVEVIDTVDFVKISWTNVENEAGYRVERRAQGATQWTTIAYRPRQETGGLVKFDFGLAADGFIATNDGYPPAPFNANTWDGKTRNMNPAVWRDYTKMAGIFEYRVVAIGCNNTNDGSSDSVAVVVVTSSKSPQISKADWIQVHPVPASGKVTISTYGQNADWVRILDINGREVWQQNSIFRGSKEINLTGWKPGIYLVQMGGPNNRKQARFVVQ